MIGRIFIYTLIFLPLTSTSQQVSMSGSEDIKSSLHEFRMNPLEDDTYYANDTTFDVIHYHLKVFPDYDNRYLLGSVQITLKSVIPALDSIQLDLSPSLAVTQNSDNVRALRHKDYRLTVFFKQSVQFGETVKLTLDYEGSPTLLNGVKGLHFRKTPAGDPLIVSLSTPYLAHTWWPCKDGPADKADSANIEII